jgi:hypothetical protein
VVLYGRSCGSDGDVRFAIEHQFSACQLWIGEAGCAAVAKWMAGCFSGVIGSC